MHPPPRRRGGVRRLLAIAVTALALPLTMLSTGTTPARAAAVQCSVDYKTNDWGSGFTADLTVTNRGSDVIDGWTLTYAYSGNQRLVNGWNGSWSQSGSTVTVRNAAHNGRIAAGAAVTTGAQFSYSGTNTAPTSFSVNGTACVGAHQPPIAVLTSPAAGSVYTQGETVPLAATAAAADQATITKVEFYDDTELLGTDTSAPFTLSVGGLAVGAHSLVAKAYDSLGASASSTPVGITVASGPAVVASPSQLGVRQGESGTFEVKLSKQPSANVTGPTTRPDGPRGWRPRATGWTSGSTPADGRRPGPCRTASPSDRPGTTPTGSRRKHCPEIRTTPRRHCSSTAPTPTGLTATSSSWRN